MLGLKDSLKRCKKYAVHKFLLLFAVIHTKYDLGCIISTLDNFSKINWIFALDWTKILFQIIFAFEKHRQIKKVS